MRAFILSQLFLLSVSIGAAEAWAQVDDQSQPSDEPTADSDGSQEAPGEAPSEEGDAEAGPVLELDGLEQELVDERGTPSDSDPEVDRFGARTAKITSASERTASILDSTTIGGYGEHEFIAGQGERSRFRNHRYIIFLFSQISKRISTATEVEFEFAGSPLKKDGLLSHGEVLLEFSVVDFFVKEWLVFRAGVLLVPVGAFNIRHDAPTRDLSDRPIAYTSIVPTTWFESGAGFHGTVPLGESQNMTYEAYLINGLDARIFDGFGLRAARGSHIEDNNQDKAFTARAAWKPTLNLELGLSGYSGEYTLRGSRVNLANADLTWRWGKFELLGEVVRAWIDPGFVEGFGGSGQANTRDAVPEDMFGFFVQANYHFRVPPLWSLFPKDLEHATMTGVVRYEGKDTNMNLDSAAGDQRRLTFGLNFRPLEAYVFKNDFQINAHGVDGMFSAPDLWNRRFWRDGTFRFVTSVAYLF